MDWTKFSNHGESDNHAFEVMCNLLFELWCKIYHTLEKERENLRIAGYWFTAGVNSMMRWKSCPKLTGKNPSCICL